MKKDTVYIIIILILGFTAFHFWSETKTYRNNVKVKEATIRTLELANGEIATERDSYKVTEKELKEQIWIKDSVIADMAQKFKDYVGTVKIVTVTKIDTLRIPLEAPDDDGIRSFSRKGPHYSLVGRVGLDFVNIDTLRMYNTQRLIIGRHKGFWNQTITAQVHNSNPHMKVTDMEVQVVMSERIKRWGVGPFIGLDILLRPTFGVGVSWDVWQF